jgi:hypothetical protein
MSFFQQHLRFYDVLSIGPGFTMTKSATARAAEEQAHMWAGSSG